MKFLFIFGKGKMTYVLSSLAIAYGIIGFVRNDFDQSHALEIIWGGLAAFGIRRAI